MKNITIPEEDGSGEYVVIEIGEINRQNPAYIFSNIWQEQHVVTVKSALRLKGEKMSYNTEREIRQDALRSWQKKYQAAMKHELPKGLLELLTAEKKKVQIKLLKEFSISTNDLLPLYIQAYNNYGFRFSNYQVSYKPKDIEYKVFPKIIEKAADSDDIHIIGFTDMSKKQLHLAIDERREMIVRFLEKDEIWHCFFWTYKGIYGREKIHQNYSHMHYVASAWGYTKEHVLTELKKRKYNLDSAHVDFNHE